jgi:hypothetical protein
MCTLNFSCSHAMIIASIFFEPARMRDASRVQR